VRPAGAVRDQLPAGFPFDPGWPWIQAIQFGSNALKESEEQGRRRAIAEELGFADSDSLELGKWFASLPAEARDQIRFFVAVELLRELDRWHRENYLALCPNHAAMFLYANASRDKLKELFAEMTGNELAIVLAQKVATIYFSTIHRDDLKAVIRAER
jgi:hypothetical protein